MLFRQWLYHFLWGWFWHTSLVVWPQSNLSNPIYNGQRYYVSSCVYYIFRILFRIVRQDHWRAAPAFVTWNYWDADLFEGLGARRKEGTTCYEQQITGRIIQELVSWCWWKCWWWRWLRVRELECDWKMRVAFVWVENETCHHSHVSFAFEQWFVT